MESREKVTILRKRNDFFFQRGSKVLGETFTNKNNGFSVLLKVFSTNDIDLTELRELFHTVANGEDVPVTRIMQFKTPEEIGKQLLAVTQTGAITLVNFEKINRLLKRFAEFDDAVFPMVHVCECGKHARILLEKPTGISHLKDIDLPAADEMGIQAQLMSLNGNKTADFHSKNEGATMITALCEERKIDVATRNRLLEEIKKTELPISSAPGKQVHH